MNETAIVVEELGKRYQIGQREPYGALRDVVMDALRRKRRAAPETIWALKDVSFKINQGEVVGIIGRNGAGKSTLLKILSRITKPTTGKADIWGRVGSLLEVGTGFHPELTGRENIYLNGAILGMRKAEIARKFDEIVAFAETEQFLDTPVKHYSSGMRVRLAFAVAAHLEPEILLVDEVLAVGDAAFQKKCLGKMGDVAKTGRTILFVSHNMAAVLNLCSRGLLLERGQIAFDGDADRAVEKYQATAVKEANLTLQSFPARSGSGLIKFQEVAIRGSAGAAHIAAGGPVSITMQLAATTSVRSANVKIGIGINSIHGERLLTLLNSFDPDAGARDATIRDGTLAICKLRRWSLRPGIYSLSFYLDINGEIADICKDAMQIEVNEADFYGTGVMPTSSQGPFLME